MWRSVFRRSPYPPCFWSATLSHLHLCDLVLPEMMAWAKPQNGGGTKVTKSTGTICFHQNIEAAQVSVGYRRFVHTCKIKTKPKQIILFYEVSHSNLQFENFCFWQIKLVISRWSLSLGCILCENKLTHTTFCLCEIATRPKFRCCGMLVSTMAEEVRVEIGKSLR